PEEGGCGWGRTQQWPLAVFLQKALGDPEGTSIDPDVLAKQEHPLVTGHFFIQGLRDGFQIRDFGCGCGGRHDSTSLSVAKTPSSTSFPSGSGLFSANSTPASISFFVRSPIS